ncbi:hypothetical protein [Chitinilyticum piscinae]|uniref:Uncharacterized protein n=1 Tax=Chitinilyticum piscinae TaxID=2866724 RepID=A0A8J7FMD2_9NEIS|nr:hypothetical protein [Chitinilyticum piscinae]MBE9609091.1 hypothetical protein [Chitinilyticum piscinae]
MKWDLVQLRNAVKARYGDGQLKLLEPSLNSTVERLYFSAFHFEQFFSCEEGFIDGPDDIRGALETVFGHDETKAELRFKARAHLVAGLQSLHSVLDILAHAVYFSMGMDRESESRIEESRIDLSAVTKKLTNLSVWPHFTSLLSSLRDDESVKYLSALVNHSKHRSIISTPVKFLCQEQGFIGLVFVEFSYKGMAYGERKACDFVSEIREGVSEMIVAIGKELNQIASSRVES